MLSHKRLRICLLMSDCFYVFICSFVYVITPLCTQTPGKHDMNSGCYLLMRQGYFAVTPLFTLMFNMLETLLHCRCRTEKSAKDFHHTM